MDGPFGWDTATQDELLEVMNYLRTIERSKLSEIFGERNRGNHQARTDQLSSCAQERLTTLRLDPDRLVSLRLASAKRIWAIRQESVLSLLWWDPHHLVWPRGPRH